METPGKLPLQARPWDGRRSGVRATMTKDQEGGDVVQ